MKPDTQSVGRYWLYSSSFAFVQHVGDYLCLYIDVDNISSFPVWTDGVWIHVFGYNHCLLQMTKNNNCIPRYNSRIDEMKVKPFKINCLRQLLSSVHYLKLERLYLDWFCTFLELHDQFNLLVPAFEKASQSTSVVITFRNFVLPVHLPFIY